MENVLHHLELALMSRCCNNGKLPFVQVYYYESMNLNINNKNLITQLGMCSLGVKCHLFQ